MPMTSHGILPRRAVAHASGEPVPAPDHTDQSDSPAHHTAPLAGSGAVVGIDVGGTRIKSTLMSLQGHILAEAVTPTPADIGQQIGVVAARAVTELTELTDLTEPTEPTELTAHPIPIRAVGLAVPGLVDDNTGTGVWSANLGWRDLDLRGAVAASVDVPVVVGHDVRTGLLAEHRLGAARHADNVLFVALGTGLASALMCRGELVTGSLWTGEIGHVSVDPAGPRCGCGRDGCLEALSSAGAIGRRWSQATGLEGDAQEVARRVAAGEPAALRVWHEAVDALASAVTPIVAAAGTDLVLIGGGLVHAGDLLLDPLEAAITRRLTAGHHLTVKAAGLGDRAGSLGAATMALDLVTRQSGSRARGAPPVPRAE